MIITPCSIVLFLGIQVPEILPIQYCCQNFLQPEYTDENKFNLHVTSVNILGMCNQVAENWLETNPIWTNTKVCRLTSCHSKGANSSNFICYRCNTFESVRSNFPKFSKCHGWIHEILFRDLCCFWISVVFEVYLTSILVRCEILLITESLISVETSTMLWNKWFKF